MGLQSSETTHCKVLTNGIPKAKHNKVPRSPSPRVRQCCISSPAEPAHTAGRPANAAARYVNITTLHAPAPDTCQATFMAALTGIKGARPASADLYCPRLSPRSVCSFSLKRNKAPAGLNPRPLAVCIPREIAVLQVERHSAPSRAICVPSFAPWGPRFSDAVLLSGRDECRPA